MARSGEDPAVRSSVKAANDNLNGDQIERTREVWQPRVGRDLSRDEAKQIAANVTGFFSFWPSGRGSNCRCPRTTIPTGHP